MRWVATEDNHVLADSVRTADTFFKRLVGLQFKRSMPKGESLWLRNCRSIHTAWMRFSIDVFFLDDGLRVVDLRRKVSPWSIVRSTSRDARHAVEAQHLDSSEAICVGLQTKFEPNPANGES